MVGLLVQPSVRLREPRGFHEPYNRGAVLHVVLRKIQLLGDLLVGLARQPPLHDHPGMLHKLRLGERIDHERSLEHQWRLALHRCRLAERARHRRGQCRHEVDGELQPRHHPLAVDSHEGHPPGSAR